MVYFAFITKGIVKNIYWKNPFNYYNNEPALSSLKLNQMMEFIIIMSTSFLPPITGKFCACLHELQLITYMYVCVLH